MKKRLLIFNPSIEDGGVEKNLFLITNFLSSKLSNVLLLSADIDQKKGFSNKIKFIHPKFNIPKKSGRMLKYFFCLILLMIEILKDRKLVILSFQANVYVICLAKIFGVKVLSRSNTAPSGWSNNFLKRSLFKFFLAKADKIIVNSLDFKKELDNRFNVKSVCIYNPFNIKQIKKKSKLKVKFDFFSKDKKSLKIINVARLTDQKDHYTLLKAFEILNYKRKSKLLIIGRGENFEKLKFFIKEKKLQKFIKLIGYNKNPFPYVKLSDVFVLSSKFEGLPNVLLEAAYLKKPIISTNCPTGPREILLNGKMGKLIKVGDYKKLSEILIDFDKNSKETKNKINMLKKKLKKYGYKKNCNKYLNLLKKYL